LLLAQASLSKPSSGSWELSATSVSIDYSAASAELEKAWQTSSTRAARLDKGIATTITSVLHGSTVTYRYILITGMLAKLMDPHAHPRALQMRSSLTGAYDARSLCHSVVVPFEHSKGDLWGFSNEPFVNKPARHPEHDKTNPQLRDKAGAALTHDALDWATKASADDLHEALILIMHLGRQRLSTLPKAGKGKGRNLQPLRRFIKEFLSVTDGGTRLVSITAAFVHLLNPEADVRAYAPNVADKFGKKAGDIEVYLSDQLVTAYECKDRPFTENDFQHGLRKAVEHRVSEYVFVSGPGLTAPFETLTAMSEASGIDASWTNIEAVIDSWTLALNSERRAMFGEVVIEYLLGMRRNEVARAAEETWSRFFSTE